MKTSAIIVATMTSILIASSQGFAQQYASPQPVTSPHLFQHHASTFQEGWLRGWADLHRAAGEYNYNSALARMYNEEAYNRYLDNEKKYAQTYFEKRELQRQARINERGPRPTRAQLTQFARQKAPGRLSAHEYQPELGQVRWPAVLQERTFAVERSAIDQLMADRNINNSGAGTENHDQISQLTSRMRGKLKEQINRLTPMQYVSAKKFLNSLEYESRHALNVNGLAANDR